MERNKDVKRYFEAAVQGDAEAAYSLGECYSCGDGVECDEAEAVRWYREAADQGHMEAAYSLGECYRWGNGVECDETEAIRWYRKAADMGHMEAAYTLAKCYDYGRGAEKDKEEAIRWYLKAAEMGHVQAMFDLGIYYFNDISCPWYEKATDPIYMKSWKTADSAEALTWYEKGIRAEPDDEAAVECYRKAAGMGFPKAMQKLAKYYNDVGLQWFRKAAEQGSTEAQCVLGDCYLEGNGVPMDKEEAIRWYRKAAEQGDDEAEYKLERLL